MGLRRGVRVCGVSLLPLSLAIPATPRPVAAAVPDHGEPRAAALPLAALAAVLIASAAATWNMARQRQ